VLQVAAAVISRGQQILVCQRRADGPHPGKWEFPGGKRRPDESLSECARREIAEELGIEVVVGPELWRTRHQYPNQEPVELFFFLVTAYRASIVNHAFAEVRWVTVGALSELDFLEADRPLVERIDQGEINLARPNSSHRASTPRLPGGRSR
jgi:8-oxo-dGTP diphosphatase